MTIDTNTIVTATEAKGEKYDPFKDSDIEGKEEFEEIREHLKKK